MSAGEVVLVFSEVIAAVREADSVTLTSRSVPRLGLKRFSVGSNALTKFVRVSPTVVPCVAVVDVASEWIWPLLERTLGANVLISATVGVETFAAGAWANAPSPRLISAMVSSDSTLGADFQRE